MNELRVVGETDPHFQQGDHPRVSQRADEWHSFSSVVPFDRSTAALHAECQQYLAERH